MALKRQRMRNEEKAKSAFLEMKRSEYGFSPLKKKRNYKDQRWIALRNEILAKNNGECAQCKSKDDVEVHHLRYLRYGKIWDSPPKDLICMCKKCHKQIHEIFKKY